MISLVVQVTRRSVLRAGGLAAGTYTLANLLQSAPSRAEPAPAAAMAPTFLTGSFMSAARGGIETNWAIARPPGRLCLCAPSLRFTAVAAARPA